MNYLADIIKGAIVGVANIIPGVSGGTMAVSMNIYKKIIHAITHLFKDFKKSAMTLLPYGIGMIIGIVGLSFLIEFLYGNYPIQTCFTFIGLILSGFPPIYKKVNHRPVKPGNVLLFALFFLLIILLQLLGGNDGSVVSLAITPMQMALLFVVGIIASATMVIPGVSGSMILMLLGYYHPVIETINATVKGLIALDMEALIFGVGILGPFGIGITAGIFIIAKIIDVLLKGHEIPTYFAIGGLVAASPVALVMGLDFSSANPFTYITALLFLAAGAVLPGKLLSLLEK